MALEHNGDLYSCEQFVDGPHKLGNIHETTIAEMFNSAQQERFGLAKTEALPSSCQNCQVRFVCNGGCQRNRFLGDANGEPGLNFLCTGYRKFFNHIAPVMKGMAAQIRAGRPPAVVMHRLQAARRGQSPTDQP